MVERSLSMREALGSMPSFSILGHGNGKQRDWHENEIFCECRFCLHQQMVPHPQHAQVPQTSIEVAVCTPTRNTAEMDTLGIEPRAFRMRSGCDTTTPCALEALVPADMSVMSFEMQQVGWLQVSNMRYIPWIES